jgi:hypothetical protein
LRLENGTILNSDLLLEVLSKDNGEIKLCHQLKPEFLTLKGNARQKVGPAKAIFSHTVAKAISVLTENKTAADFFDLIDSFFDIMNSKRPLSNIRLINSAFGITDDILKEQKEVLRKVKHEVENMRVVGKKSILPFQKGIIISISSLIDLYEEQKSKGIKYIMTCRLTQDVLESFFGQLRGVGRFNDHPTPTEVIYRFRRLLLSNKLPKPSPKSNIINIENENENCTQVATSPSYLTAELLDSVFKKDPSNAINCEGTAPINAPLELDVNLESDTEADNEDEELRDTIEKKGWAEEESIDYIAGFIAFKVRKFDPSLGSIPKKHDEGTTRNTIITGNIISKIVFRIFQLEQKITAFLCFSSTMCFHIPSLSSVVCYHMWSCVLGFKKFVKSYPYSPT